MAEEMIIEQKLSSDQFKALCSRHHVRLAVLFGSRAEGEALSGSDWDLAFWFKETDLQSVEQGAAVIKRRLVKDLCSLLQTSQLDVIILNRASPFLKYQVARKGKPLYQESKDTFASFISLAIRSSSDFRIFQKAGRKYLEMGPAHG